MFEKVEDTNSRFAVGTQVELTSCQNQNGPEARVTDEVEGRARSKQAIADFSPHEEDKA